MKTIEIKSTVFEPGDVLNIVSVDAWDSMAKIMKESDKILIINVRKTGLGLVSYKFISQAGRVGKATANMLSEAEFVEHIKALDGFFTEDIS